MQSFRPKFGEVYRAICAVPSYGTVIFRAPASSGFDCIIPEGTRVVVIRELVEGASGVQLLPLNYREFEDRFVPQKERGLPQYQGYGVGVLVDYLQRHFVKEDVANVTFDDERAQRYWESVLKSRLK